ncbi:energy coupling factor transporter S component ThiW [Gracilibacillus oryzae]|uniref:energy coupling factor transporter S component ThiW n=1 Tax=Gracilibacillus oryzae TaxID=1672701 RepID=UPI003898E529
MKNSTSLALPSVPFAYLLMGTSVGILAFLPGFLVSSISGAIIGVLILSRVNTTRLTNQTISTKA